MGLLMLAVASGGRAATPAPVPLARATPDLIQWSGVAPVTATATELSFQFNGGTSSSAQLALKPNTNYRFAGDLVVSPPGGVDLRIADASTTYVAILGLLPAPFERGFTTGASGSVTLSASVQVSGAAFTTIQGFVIEEVVAVPSVSPPVAVPPPVQPVELPPTQTIDTMAPWYARLAAADRAPGAVYALSGTIPRGLRINAKTGYLRWTPDHTQVGVHAFSVLRDGAAIKSCTLTVVLAGSAPTTNAYYMVPGGTGTGTFASPAGDLQTVSKKLKAGDTLYLRGGLYRNAEWGDPFAGRTKSSLALLSGLTGAVGSPITIRNFGNEYVTLQSDALVIAAKDLRYVDFEGIEFKGTTSNIDRDKAVSLWWKVNEETLETSGTGIAMNSCQHVNIRRCVVTDMTDSGLSNNYGEYIFVEDSIIAACARWAVGGVHGWSNSKPGTGIDQNRTDLKIAARRNLIVGSQQCIPSRVPAKGFADMAFDEGKGLHSQAQDSISAQGGVMFGRWEMTDNLLVYGGSAGASTNGTGDIVIARNSFYRNVQASDGAELSISPAPAGTPSAAFAPAQVENNLFHALPGKQSILKFGSDKTTGIGVNYIVNGGHAQDADYIANTPAESVAAVFVDPANNDFRKHPSIPAGNGCPDDVIANLLQMAEEFGVDLAKAPIDVDDAYKQATIQAIIDSWPAPESLPAAFGPNFELHVGDHHYTYATRAAYPGDPGP